MPGPLSGSRVIELSGMGPIPFCGQLLADLGADVVRIDRPTQSSVANLGVDPRFISARSKRSVVLNLKEPTDVDNALRLIDTADAVLEGSRPRVTDRLGLGPQR